MSSCILVLQFFLTYGSKLVLCFFKDLIEEVAEYSFKRYRVHGIINNLKAGILSIGPSSKQMK